MPNGTISMIQPEVVRRVLGLGSQSVTLCLEVKTSQSNELKLFPAECRPQINPLVQVFLYRNATLTSTERITQRRRELQSFDFLLRNGESQRAYKT